MVRLLSFFLLFIFFFVFLVLLKAHFISSISSNFDYSELVMSK